MQLQGGAQDPFQLRVCRVAPVVQHLIEELALHVVMMRMERVHVTFAEQTGLVRLTAVTGFRVGFGQELLRRFHLSFEAIRRLGLHPIMPAIADAPKEGAPSQQ